MKKIIPITVAGAVLAVSAPVGLAVAANADDDGQDHERRDHCGRADAKLSVERDDGGFEVEAEIDDARPGSRWRIVLRHDGRVFVKTVKRAVDDDDDADDDGEIEINRFRPDTRGDDVFRLRAKQLGTDRVCKVVVRTR